MFKRVKQDSGHKIRIEVELDDESKIMLMLSASDSTKAMEKVVQSMEQGFVTQDDSPEGTVVVPIHRVKRFIIGK